MSGDRLPALLLGRTIGTATFAEQVGDFEFVFNEFEPIADLKSTLQEGDLCIDFITGQVATEYSDDGKAINPIDIADVISKAPKATPEEIKAAMTEEDDLII